MESMIKAAASVGVDIIKFQSFRADKLRKDWPDYENAYRYYKAHELSEDDHIWLMEKCRENGIEFLTTAFTLDVVDFLAGIGLKQVKIASPDANNWALIDRCLEKFEKVFISTGLHTSEEVFNLKTYLGRKHVINKRVAILHCVSLYPVELEQVKMTLLKHSMIGPYNSWTEHGFSDHTTTLGASKLAISLGADYIERHFSLSRYLPGKDHFFSSTPEEFAELVAWKSKVEIMMGTGTRELSPEELANREEYRGRWSA
jgi:sialic acid synthase SpsE